MKTLVAHKRYNRPLPDLLPFPYKPDETVHRCKKNNTKVPKPSKFTKGEMYHSDYESDFEGTIRVKWRAAQSDTEDSDFIYKRVHPELRRGFKQRNQERKASPPCPHMWESHEDIEKMENEMKNQKRARLLKIREKNRSMSYSDSTCRSEIISSQVNCEQSQTQKNNSVFYEATAIASSTSNLICDEPKEEMFKAIKNHGPSGGIVDEYISKQESPPPIPPKNRLNVLTPSPSRNGISPARSADSGSFSDEFSSQSTIRVKTTNEYIKVREKVMHFEKKVEEDYLRQA